MNDILKKQLANFFEQDYQGPKAFVENVILNIFNGSDTFENTSENYLSDDDREAAANAGILSIVKIGEIDTYEGIEVFDITLADDKRLQYNRVGIQNYIRKNLFGSSAFMIFHNEHPEGKEWRFSFFDKPNRTSAKRYTYLFSRSHRARTASERFAILADKEKTNQTMTDAFSVKDLSDEFFDDYREQYSIFCDYLFEHRNESDKFGQEFAVWEEKYIRDYVKKMMGRITFIYFLQRKGWMNGDQNYMQNAFLKSSKQDDYLDAFLEPLFFGVLNTKPEQREQLFLREGWDLSLLSEWKDVPYLNGGLFERDEQDEPRSCFPANMFKSLFDFYADYNFTIDENDPEDAEVGVDPEMLGKIFESLLEDNKDKGAFYTPKEIVDYMCQESLIAYLQTDVTDDATREGLRLFVETRDASYVNGSGSALAQQIESELKQVKICDPAIGSGAFPMGLLNLLVRCREALGNAASRVELKREIIQNNIYGVDIEKGAIDIARLRFWLSLIVDEETAKALPNLDFKIMQGNSLVEELGGVNLSDILKSGSNDGQLLFVDEDNMEKVLVQENIRRYFEVTEHEERDCLRKQIENSIRQLIIANNFRLKDEVATINLVENEHFFLWHTFFADVFNRKEDAVSREGFDIVIGNPPYINVQLMSDSEKQLYRRNYTSFFKRCDMFCLFLELGLLKLSARKGIVTLIIPSVVHSNMSYQKIRDIILNRKWLQEVHYTGGDVFNAPTVDTTILVCNKGGNKQITLTDAIDFVHPKSHQVPADYFGRYNNVISIGDDHGSEIFDKLFNSKFDIVDHHYNIFQGIVTGNNPAFIFENEQEALDKNVDASLLHSLCHGRDVEKYKVRSRERRILYINNDIEIDNYPNTKKWLLNFKAALDTRREVKRGVIKWFCLQWPRVKSELDITEKIMLQRTRNESLPIRIVATLDDAGVYGMEGIYFIIPKHSEDSLRYLLGILNSKLINYLFATKFLNLAIKAEYVKQVRIPKATDEQQTQIEGLVNQVLERKNNNSDTTSLESEIDCLVYRLYGLTYDEVLIVDPETTITKKEYESKK